MPGTCPRDVARDRTGDAPREGGERRVGRRRRGTAKTAAPTASQARPPGDGMHETLRKGGSREQERALLTPWRMSDSSNNATLIFVGGAELDVRNFTVREAMSELFEISVTAVSPDATLDLASIVGKGAALRIVTSADGTSRVRVWAGLCAFAQQASSHEAGSSAYAFTLVPTLARAALRTNCRIFQHKTIPQIVQAILAEWQIAAEVKLNDDYRPLEYRVQFQETDYTFLARLLEEGGSASTSGKLRRRDQEPPSPSSFSRTRRKRRPSARGRFDISVTARSEPTRGSTPATPPWRSE